MSHFNIFDGSQVELPAGALPVGGLLGVVEQLIRMSHIVTLYVYYWRLDYCCPTTRFYQQYRFHLRGDVSKEAGMEEPEIMNLSLADIGSPAWFEFSL